MRNIFLIFFAVMVTSVMAQPLQDVKICIDPGHGGYESDDRYIPATGFWESASNLDKAFYLRDMLEGLGATIVLTRDGNDGILDDPSLSQRVAIANSNNVDFMHSIHSNGYDGTRNSSLMLFQGFDNQPTYPEAMEMGAIMAPELFLAHRTTGYSNRGDFDFYGTGQIYLGIFRGLNMPGTLSEGSFHDYIPESWRLLNTDYRMHEAWAIMISFRKYFNTGLPSTGVLAGVVRDAERDVPYFYLTQADRRVPVNNIRVTIKNTGLDYTGDNLNNGFFVFDSLEPGSYEIVFDASGYFKDSTTVNIVAGKTVFADANLIADGTLIPPPATPNYVRVLAEDQQSIKIMCDSVSFADNYVVYYGTDGVNFPDSMVIGQPSLTISGLLENEPVYLKVKATNITGSSPFTRHVYAGAATVNPSKILIVNGFDRSTNTRFDYVRQYGGPVTTTGNGFSYVLNETVIAGKIKLDEFDIVIWILGDESTADETFSTSEQTLVKAFLQNGGRLFVTGAEIGWDLDNQGSTTDRTFYNQYLKADYVADAPGGVQYGDYETVPLAGEIFDGLGTISFDNGTHGTFDVDWPDAINGINGGVNIIRYRDVTTSNIAGVRYEGQFPGGTLAGKLIYLGFPFEAIYNSVQREQLMEKVMQYLDTPVGLSGVDIDIMPTTAILTQNYPNPFNPSTTIAFQLSAQQTVSLVIYNILGKKVRTLIDNADYAAGAWKIQWDGRDETGRPASSGTYLYRLSGPGFQLESEDGFSAINDKGQ